MRVNKIFGVKSITNLIYGMLLLLPMVSILSRVIYTQANPNAKESYSDNRITAITKLDNNNMFVENLTYYVKSKPNSANASPKYYYSYISIDLSNYPTADYFKVADARTGQYWLEFYDNTDTLLKRYKWGTNSNTDDITEFYFTFLSSVATSSANVSIVVSADVYYYYTQENSLDNVFEYSLNTFLDDYDNQGVDFFSWFTNLFLNQSNQHNALYLNFCNWYMNYVLLVSSAYLLFFALMWFINYIRKLLEKSSYHDFGGF